MLCKLDRLLLRSAKSRIVFSILNTVLQVALQASLILVTRKVQDDLAGASCFQLDALGWFNSLLENILLISLHLLALALHIFAVKNNSPSFAPLLLIMFGLSFGSSVVQLLHILKLKCEACNGICLTPSTAGMVATTALRFCLSLIFLIVLVVWNIPWRTSFINNFAWKTSIPILAYLVCGTTLVRNEQPYNNAIFWVWVTFTAALVLIVTGTEMARFSRLALRKNTPPMTSVVDPSRGDLHADANIRMRMPPQTLPSTTHPPVGLSDSTSELLVLEGLIAHSAGPTESSNSSPKIRSSVLTAFTNSKLSTEAWSARSSIAETFHTAVRSRSSMSSVLVGRSQSPDREQTSMRVRDLAQGTVLYTDSSPRASVAEEEPRPRSSRSSDSEQLPLPHREGTHRPPSHRFSGSSRSTVSANSATTRDGEEDNLRSESSGEPEPAELLLEGMGMTPFPRSSSSSPIPPTPSVSPNTPTTATTVPPYTEGPGPYAYRHRRDTLASNGTYETLPSYHSRRSSQTLTEMMNGNGPPTPRHVRSLPPLPPLPPFMSLSESILSTASSLASPGIDISTADDGEVAQTAEEDRRR